MFLLQELVRRWQNHKIMNTWMLKFFMYLDRFHVKYQDLSPLDTAGLNHFRKLVYEAVCKDAANAIMTLINQVISGPPHISQSVLPSLSFLLI